MTTRCRTNVSEEERGTPPPLGMEVRQAAAWVPPSPIPLLAPFGLRKLLDIRRDYPAPVERPRPLAPTCGIMTRWTLDGVVYVPRKYPVIPLPTKPEPEVRSYALRLYLRFRQDEPSHEKALERTVAAIETERLLSPVALRRTVERWAVEDAWELAFQNKQRLKALDERELQDQHQLSEAIDIVRHARDLLDQAVADAQSPDATPNEWRKWKTAQDAYLQAVEHLNAIEARVRRKSLEGLAGDEQTKIYEELRQRLLAQYGDRGVQYEVLAELLAAATVRIRLAQRSGRDVDASEFRELTKIAIDVANQLQRFTESMKVESIRPEVQKGILAALAIVERHLAGMPNVWRGIVREIKARCGDLPDDAQEGAA